MIARPGTAPAPMAMALNLALSHGRHGATARIEIHERGEGRVALLALRGWIDQAAVHHLRRALADLETRGVQQLLLDCSHLHHIDYRWVPLLVESLERFETRAGGFVVCGLSRYLRDLFRLAGVDSRLRCWPTAAELLPPAPCEPTSERAS